MIYTIQLVYEIKIHQQLSHPNVVHLDHWFEDAEYQYIFMEYCSEGVYFI
jgi:serine/threonine protein kinase